MLSLRLEVTFEATPSPYTDFHQFLETLASALVSQVIPAPAVVLRSHFGN